MCGAGACVVDGVGASHTDRNPSDSSNSCGHELRREKLTGEEAAGKINGAACANLYSLVGPVCHPQPPHVVHHDIVRYIKLSGLRPVDVSSRCYNVACIVNLEEAVVHAAVAVHDVAGQGMRQAGLRAAVSRAIIGASNSQVRTRVEHVGDLVEQQRHAGVACEGSEHIAGSE